MLKIAIDGPAGAGKSTLARRLSERLNITYLDTGAMYRAIGLKALRLGYDARDAAKVEPMLKSTALDVTFDNGEQRLLLDGEDVTGQIRSPEVSAAASDVSAHGAVRGMLLERQRSIAQRQSVVMDGRDIGTRVLPDATVKFFLEAPVEVRARRRFDELKEKGEDVVFERVLEDMRRRDAQDSGRALDPLRSAGDAVVLDTGNAGIEELVGKMLRLIAEKGEIGNV